MSNGFQSQAAKIASSNRPFALVFQYATGAREQGEVLSTHKTHQLAAAASRRSGYDTFLTIRDAREYA